MKRRDIFQRKAYAIHRMSMAAKRVIDSTSMVDREKSRNWMTMWAAVSGIRQFKLGNGGGNQKRQHNRSR